MGSPADEKGRGPDEGPQTVVTISRGFWMSKYETTQAQYERIMGTNPSKFTGDPKRPVEMVSWTSASLYCEKLTAHERAAGRLPSKPAGYVYRLPTEAEWEYCCRAGTTNRFEYGDDPDYAQLVNYAWFSSNSDGQTHPAGVGKPNAWGLYDMHGNVWEWCLDWKGTAYSGGFSTDPKGASAGSIRVYRGGSYSSSDRQCRTACRGGVEPDATSDVIGIRTVLAPGR